MNQEVSVVFKDTFFAAGHIKALQLIFLKLHLLIFDHLGAVLSTVIDTALTYYHLLKVLFVRKKLIFDSHSHLIKYWTQYVSIDVLG